MTHAHLTGRTTAGFVAVVAATVLAHAYVSSAGTAPAEAARRTYHLLLTSNRDGDWDVYAADAGGTRVAALTRDGRDDADLAASADGRWIAVARTRLIRPTVRGGTYLVSADGRHQRLVAEDRGMVLHRPVEFSPDGRWLAIERNDLEDDARTLLVPTLGGRTRKLGVGKPLSFSPDGRFLLVEGRVRDLRTARSWPTGPVEEPLWSPASRRLAFVRYGDDKMSLHVLDLTRPASRPRRLMRGNLLDAVWGSDSRLRYWRQEEDRDSGGDIVRRTEIGTVTLAGAVTVVERASNIVDAEWSPRGGYLTYAVEVSEDRYAHYLRPASGRWTRTLAGNPRWSPSGRRYLMEVRRRGRRDLLVVDPANGRVTRALRWPGNASGLAWSPDERHVAFLLRRGRGTAVGVVSLASGLRRVVLGGGQIGIVDWVAGPLPRSAPRATPPPPLEVASADGVRSEGHIVEIAASGPRVAALVDQSPRDCDHAFAWTVGRRPVVRFAAPAPCDSDGPVPYGQHFFGLTLGGSRLTWFDFYCGNFCYESAYRADLRRPGRQSETNDIPASDERLPSHPRPRAETRRGVTMTVRAGTVLLRRGRDGRIARVRPAGALADAELEAAGLFYAFNVRHGARPGRLVFVPFGRIFA